MDGKIIVLFLIIGAIVVLAIFASISARKRREELAALAMRLNLKFAPGKDHEIASRFGFLNKLAQGSNRYGFNVFSGIYGGEEVLIFDYHYETYSRDSKGKRETNHHYLSFFILMLPRSFPELHIGPEGLFSKIAQAFGYDDIDFESAEFSRKYCVRSKDKKFAYDVCNPQMMEYLLANEDLIIEIENRALAFGFNGCLSVERIEPNLNRLIVIRSKMPEYLFTPV